LAILSLDLPAVLLFVVDRRRDARIELNVATQVKLVGNIIEIALVLWLAGEMLFPVPLLQQFLRERIAVAVTLGVEARPRVAVPIPGASDAPTGFVNLRRESEL
jgi:hypothetical protein